MTRHELAQAIAGTVYDQTRQAEQDRLTRDLLRLRNSSLLDIAVVLGVQERSE